MGGHRTPDTRWFVQKAGKLTVGWRLSRARPAGSVFSHRATVVSGTELHPTDTKIKKTALICYKGGWAHKRASFYSKIFICHGLIVPPSTAFIEHWHKHILQLLQKMHRQKWGKMSWYTIIFHKCKHGRILKQKQSAQTGTRPDLRLKFL